MMVPDKRFVLFPIGKKRFALPAEDVAELAKPDRLQVFPHTTPLMSGVLVRRGSIIPVCDIAQVLVGPSAPTRRFYLIATRDAGRKGNLIALPVSGECELAAIDPRPQTGRLPDYVLSLLAVGEEIIQVLSLPILMSDNALAISAGEGRA
jgi:chemotaxis signal transduction protein